MIRLIATSLVLVMGCAASTPVIQYAGIKEKQHVENKTLPDRPDKDKIPKGEDWVVPLPAAKCTLKSDETKVVETDGGILFSPAKAVRAALWKSGYEGLRTLFDIDRQVWREHRIIYDERMGQANAELKRRSPSWWDENKGTVAWASGFLMGAAATIAIVYAVDEVKEL